MLLQCLLAFGFLDLLGCEIRLILSLDCPVATELLFDVVIELIWHQHPPTKRASWFQSPEFNLIFVKNVLSDFVAFGIDDNFIVLITLLHEVDLLQGRVVRVKVIKKGVLRWKFVVIIVILAV